MSSFLTHLGSFITSGARRSTGSSGAGNAGGTTLTGETSVALQDRRDTVGHSETEGQTELLMCLKKLQGSLTLGPLGPAGPTSPGAP